MKKSPSTPSKPLSIGDVPEGWRAKAWKERLIELAELCQQANPQRALELREWAGKVKDEH